MPREQGEPLLKSRIGKAVGLGLIITLVAALIVVGIFFVKGPASKESNSKRDNPNYGSFSKAGVSCDSPLCAQVAKQILEKGGTVADAAIAGLLVMGVEHSQSMGIGGGFFMILYNSTTKTAKMLNARETAPAFATEGMFGSDSNKSQKGGLAVAIPGEIRGYGELWKRHGALPWKTLFEPAINIARNGFKVSAHTAFSITNEWKVFQNSSSMAEIFTNPKTGKGYVEGEMMTRKKLAETLEILAEKGPNEFYSGNIAKWFIHDLKEFGGNLTMDDMRNYKVKWSKPLRFEVHGNLSLYGTPPPGSGVLLGFIFKLLSGYGMNPSSVGSRNETVKSYQRIIEAFKHAFAYRTQLGDPFDESIADMVHGLVQNLTSDDYVNEIRQKIDATQNETKNDYEFYGAKFYTPDDHGTSHISIISETGDAISVTSTINTYFGARIRSRQTDIIYNNEMDDFAVPGVQNYFGVPASINNLIKPGKQPLSSMTPAIFVDQEGRCKLVIGAAGGTKIITSTAIASIRSLWFQENLLKAVDSPRFHHQLYPMELDLESKFDENIASDLKALRHVLHQNDLKSAVSAVLIENNTVFAKADKRKDGSISGI